MWNRIHFPPTIHASFTNEVCASNMCHICPIFLHVITRLNRSRSIEKLKSYFSVETPMFCSVTESVNKEVEVETVGEGAQLAQPAHLKKALSSKIFTFSPSIAQGRTSVACWRQGRSPSPPPLRSSPPFPCICSLAPVQPFISLTLRVASPAGTPLVQSPVF